MPKQDNAAAINDETITVSLDGHEASAVIAAITVYLELAKQDAMLADLFAGDVPVLQRWVKRISAQIAEKAARQRAAARSNGGAPC